MFASTTSASLEEKMRLVNVLTITCENITIVTIVKCAIKYSAATKRRCYERDKIGGRVVLYLSICMIAHILYIYLFFSHYTYSLLRDILHSFITLNIFATHLAVPLILFLLQMQY